MLELKMSPAAKTFLISGFPRNMRDVVEYSNKVRTLRVFNIQITKTVNGDEYSVESLKTYFNRYLSLFIPRHIRLVWHRDSRSSVVRFFLWFVSKL